MRAGEIVFAVVCASWWLVTLLAQSTSPRVMRWRARDVLHLLPAYRFFAPTPEFRDRALEFRLEEPGHSPGPWQPFRLYVPRSWSSILWHPHKLSASFLEAWSERLLAVQAHRGNEAAATTRVYAEVLAYVQRNAPTADSAARVQFRILTAPGYDPAVPTVPAFRSQWHRLAA